MFRQLCNLFKKESKRKEPYILKGIYDLSYQIDPNSALDDQIVKFGIIQDWIASNLCEFINENGDWEPDIDNPRKSAFDYGLDKVT